MTLLRNLIVLGCITFSQLLFSDSIEKLDHFIENARIKSKVPGVAVVIVQGDKIIFAKGYGVCHYDRPEKVNENTIFQLASVSKTFASAGLGIQVDKKKLKWDDEIVIHMPQFVLKDPYSTRYATARDLLAHRTGLPAFGGDLLGKLGYQPNEILYRVRFINPATSFRNKALYSNVGFFIAGQLLEKLSNDTWENTIQRTLLEPLQMTRSGFAVNLQNINSSCYHAEIDGKIQAIFPDPSVAFVAAGGVTSTAKDMGNWMIMHLNNGVFEGKQILQSETLREMFLPSMASKISFTELPPINEYSSFSYGLGWDNYNCNGKYIVEKAGALDGIRTVVTLVPELKIGICVFANLNLTVLPELIRAKFLETYLNFHDDKLEAEFEKHQKELAKIVEAPAKLKEALPLGHPLEKYTGSFYSELYGEFIITEENHHLVVNAGPAHLKGTLNHWSNDTFILKWPLVNSGNELLTFTFGENGKATVMEGDSLGTFKTKDGT